jgi:MFS family permease
MARPHSNSGGTAFVALRHKDFAVFWTAAVVSNSASMMQMIAVAAAVYDLSGQQGTWLGIVGLATSIPLMVLTPIAGVLADRLPRRLILVVTQIVQAVAAFVLWALHLSDALTPWRIVGLVFVGGIAGGFQIASWQSFVPTLVPREHLLDAVRLNSVQFTAARAIGPGVGAVALGAWGLGAAFFLNAVTYVLVIVAILLSKPRQTISSSAQDSFRAVFVEGARYVAHHPTIRLVVLAGFVISVFGQSLMTLAAGVSSDVYGHRSTDGGWLLASMGVGAVVMSVFVVSGASRYRRTTLTTVSLVLYIIGLAMVPLTRSFEFGLVAFFVVGLAHLLVATSMNTFLQAYVADEIRGRTLSFYLLGIVFGTGLGAMVMGRLADVVGMRSVLAVNAVAFAVAGALVVRAPSYRAMDDELDQQRTHAASSG